MIPKTIHYCWFGCGEKPKLAQKCISSWKAFFPDYEIREWNERNYDVAQISYTRDAYAAGKYAFVSDYARFDILYRYGGLYFDTDVEVIRPFGDILARGTFMGCEQDGGTARGIMVNPGLGLAAAPGLGLYQEITDYYSTQRFLRADGSGDLTTVVTRVTEILRRHGLRDEPGLQAVDGVTIYPAEFFNPLESTTGRLTKTDNTHSIHWYSKSWLPKSTQLRCKITNACRRALGERCFDWLKRT